MGELTLDQRSAVSLFRELWEKELPGSIELHEAVMINCVDNNMNALGYYVHTIGGKTWSGIDISLILTAVIISGAVGF